MRVRNTGESSENTSKVLFLYINGWGVARHTSIVLLPHSRYGMTMVEWLGSRDIAAVQTVVSEQLSRAVDRNC